MSSQLFKIVINQALLCDFLNNNAEKYEDHYMFSKFLYKKSDFNNRIVPFLEILKPYYHDSKKKYIERKMDYCKFITIIRQLCNVCNMKYTTKLVYNNSSYEIVYYIFHNETQVNPSSFITNSPPSPP